MLSPSLAFLCLTLALNGVNALNAAAPYEAIYFYNAYKMEYATVSDPALRTIATGCVHRGPRAGIPATSPPGIVEANFIQSTVDAGVVGICSFDDFLRHIQSPGWSAYNRINPSVANPTSQSITLEPDADAVSARVNNPARIGRNRLLFDATKLLSPAVLTPIEEHAPNGDIVHPYGKVISKISDAVQTARVAHANGIGPAAFQGWVDYSVKLLDAVGHFRIGDNSRFFVPAIQADASWTSSPMNTHAVINDEPYHNIAGDPVTVKSITDPATMASIDVVDFKVIDYEASFAAARAAGTPVSPVQKTALTNFVQNYGIGPPAGYTGPDLGALKAAKVHRDVIDAVKFSKALHQTPITIEDPDSSGSGCGCCIIM